MSLSLFCSQTLAGARLSLQARPRVSHDGEVTPVNELVAAVDAAFVETRREMAGWPDPHPDRMPLDEEYSRVTNPHRWRILGARAEAWFAVLVDAGLAKIEAQTEVAWQKQPRTIVTRTDRAVPRTAEALPLVVARSRLAEVEDAGVTLGVGDPVAVLAVIPDCGCDACDSGSQDALDEFDEYVLSVVTGSYRQLWRGKREITVISEHRNRSSGFKHRRFNLGGFMMRARPLARPLPASASSVALLRGFKVGVAFPKRRRDHFERILANPKGWNELSGAPWFNEIVAGGYFR